MNDAGWPDSWNLAAVAPELPAHLIPLTLLAAIWLALPRGAALHGRRRWAPAVFAAGFAAPYLHWRFFDTVLPAEGLNATSLLVWTVFVIESLAWFGAVILFLQLARRTDRSPEADRHAARLSGMPPETLPTVDVFVCTYDESLEVLERTLLGALALDWPATRLRVHCLDDGRRGWLADWCAGHGVRHVTRPDNRHAKAGNINHALTVTDGELILILDADFVPRRDMLRRMAGFFEDPRIGIVQAPHAFFNFDPVQANLGVRGAIPSDQRFFFHEVMPGRDGWDCAFCCGSNSLTRRSAFAAIGGAMPTGSVTEDMLLTMALLRKGLITRYLDERLAVGLAPESLAAFFVQRARWARGALQLLYLREGPLGPGLTPMQRLQFLPVHWLVQALSRVTALSLPAIYLLTGILPMIGVTLRDVLLLQAPAFIAMALALRALAPRSYFPLADSVLGALMAIRLLPSMLWTLVRPFGHAFKVTPKGADAGGGARDGVTLTVAGALAMATGLGIWLNADFETRLIPDVELFPVVAAWSIVNLATLLAVLAVAHSPPPLRVEERFDVDEPTVLQWVDGAVEGRLRDMSPNGALLACAPDHGLSAGDWGILVIDEVGPVAAEVRRVLPRGLGLRFAHVDGPEREALIRRLFTAAPVIEAPAPKLWAATYGILAGALRPRPPPPPAPPPAAEMPPGIRVARAALARELGLWAGEAEAPSPIPTRDTAPRLIWASTA